MIFKKKQRHSTGLDATRHRKMSSDKYLLGDEMKVDVPLGAYVERKFLLTGTALWVPRS